MKTCELRTKVNFCDTDAMAVAHHANYFRWFEMGRVELLRSVGIYLNDMTEDGYTFPIKSAACEYKTSARFDDWLIVETIPVALTPVKMLLEYKVYREADRLLLAEGQTQNVFTSIKTGKIVKLPAKYTDRFKLLMQD